MAPEQVELSKVRLRTISGEVRGDISGKLGAIHPGQRKTPGGKVGLQGLATEESEKISAKGIVHYRVKSISLEPIRRMGPDLPDQIRLGIDGADPASELPPELGVVDLLGHIEAPAVDSLLHPVLRDFEQKLPDRLGIGVELRQRGKVSPGAVAEDIVGASNASELLSVFPARESDDTILILEVIRIEMEPVEVGRTRAVFQDMVELIKPSAHVVKDPVEDNSDSPAVSFRYEGVEVSFVTEDRVDLEVVVGVVAVICRGLKDRVEVEGVYAELLKVVEVLLYSPQGASLETVYGGPRLPGFQVLRFRALVAGKTVREDLIEDRVRHPVRGAPLCVCAHGAEATDLSRRCRARALPENATLRSMCAMTLYQFARIVEIRTKIVSISAYLIGTLLAVYQTGSFDPGVALLMLLAVLAVDMGTTGFNSFFDYYRGVDSRETNRESDKVLVHQGVPPGIALLVSLALFALAMPLGILLAFLVGWELIPVGALCMAVGYLYNGGPLPISRTPLGELAAGGFLGSVLLLLSFYTQHAALTTEALLVSLPSLLFVASILTVNNTCDIEGDRMAGRKTLSILLGPRVAPWLIYILGIAGFALTGYNAYRGALPACSGYLALLAAPLVILEYRRMHRRGYSHETKGPSMGSISKVFLIYTVVVVLPLTAHVVFSAA